MILRKKELLKKRKPNRLLNKSMRLLNWPRFIKNRKKRPRRLPRRKLLKRLRSRELLPRRPPMRRQ
jgi:hypothetical protein